MRGWATRRNVVVIAKWSTKIDAILRIGRDSADREPIPLDISLRHLGHQGKDAQIAPIRNS